MIMDILSVKWIQVITVSGKWRQVSAPPARDLGDDFTVSTLNQAEKVSLSVAKGDFGVKHTRHQRVVGFNQSFNQRT
jgi:hypothetical protein